jgi:hypothetical protein
MNKYLLLAALLPWTQPASADGTNDLNAAGAQGVVGSIQDLKNREAEKPKPLTKGGIGVFSDGYRMGMLSAFSVNGVINKSGEGELMLGKDSSLAYIDVPDPFAESDDSKQKTGNDAEDEKPKMKKEQINPWKFSSDPDFGKEIMKLNGRYVVVHYVHYRVGSFKRDTEYDATEVTPVDKQADPKVCENDKAVGHMSPVSRAGRIVRASYTGSIIKTYELTMQIGDAGSQFFQVSTLSEDIYNCAIAWLKSGKQVNLTYKQSMFGNTIHRNTTLDVVKIEPVDTL